jgi:AraC family transcriptional regulator
MSAEGSVARGWQPLVYFWDGGWLGVGRASGQVPSHAHHAVQISIGLSGPVRLRHADEDWMQAGGGVVLPDVEHAFDPLGSEVAMIFVDPESSEGRWLRDSLDRPILLVDTGALGDHLTALARFRHERPDATAAAATITGVVRRLCAGPPPLHSMDPRIVHALRVIREGDVRQMALEEAARSVFLSGSRFAHLFKEEVGLPFRRYMLWRKLSRAMSEFGRGASLTDAAHAAGFADSAHLTRTWRQMFGLSPSMMLGKGRFYEIPAPFELMR